MKVHWTDTAEGHLDALYAYIARDSPEYAKRMVDRLTRRSQQIANFPFSGRRVPEYDIDQIREVIEGPYRIIYHIKPDQIDVLAVIHGAMDVLRSSEEEDDQA
ncbi:MAG: type II toxin-antitoxin system RelE/ParE family toxin [Thermodesulfobacteriota bacterium]|nr:type II toxin-antitoxin system RelE/ParE family toxin [Thermodesulfobacteriota bacterium]